MVTKKDALMVNLINASSLFSIFVFSPRRRVSLRLPRKAFLL
jgi:hypothetical protein